MSVSNEELLEMLISSRDFESGVMAEVMDRILSASLSKAQVAAALALIRVKGISALALGEAAEVALSKATNATGPAYMFGDIVGTGGDGQNTINASTMASLTAASVGMPVAKHGYVSVSSRCGSADLLRELGLDMNLPYLKSRQSLDELKWCFLFAPNHHPTFKAVREIRAELKIKTIFNILGPLANPWSPPIMVLGVYDPELIQPYIEALRLLGRSRALVVHGSGLDEIALHGFSSMALLKDGGVERFNVSPYDLGLKEFSLASIRGGSPSENAKECLSILGGFGSDAKTSMVAASAGALLWLGDHAESLKIGVEKALAALRAGLPLRLFNEIRRFHRGS
jgi:anthranilate phosphoribosyltransferase